MLLNKEKGEVLCKLCLDKKKVTRTAYASSDSEDYEEKDLVDDKSDGSLKNSNVDLCITPWMSL